MCSLLANSNDHLWEITTMSKRNSMYKGTPRDSTMSHEVRELAHMHNMEQRGIGYPKSINIHNLGDQLEKLMNFFNAKLAYAQRIYEDDEDKLKERVKDIHKEAELAAALCKKRFFKQEVGSAYDPHQGQKECNRRLQREFGRCYIDHVESTYPTAAAALKEAGLVEEGTDIVVPWKTHVRENIDMIHVVG